MTNEMVENLSTSIDDLFFIFGAAILAIEIIQGLLTRRMTGRTFLDMLASLSTQLPFLAIETVLLVTGYVAYETVSETYITWALPISVTALILGVVLADFTYYWEHRIAHEVRLLWTQHAVHHSSRYMNIITGIRFGPAEGVWSLMCHFPLILLGLPAEAVFFGILTVQAYQTWIHTELVGRLGPLDSILNTPSNHRVHHGCDSLYLDKNYGGILILWDRLFGTYQREEHTPRYGLVRDFDSVNPLRVWFSELPALCRDIVAARSASQLKASLFARPGTGRTAGRTAGD